MNELKFECLEKNLLGCCCLSEETGGQMSQLKGPELTDEKGFILQNIGIKKWPSSQRLQPSSMLKKNSKQF